MREFYKEMEQTEFITKVAVYYPDKQLHSNAVLFHISSNGFRALEYSSYKEVTESLVLNKCKYGIIYCGEDLDLVSKINKMKDIRCVMALNDASVKQARAMLDANVLCITSTLSEESTIHILNTFLSTEYNPTPEMDRYIKLINQLSSDDNMS